MDSIVNYKVELIEEIFNTLFFKYYCYGRDNKFWFDWTYSNVI